MGVSKACSDCRGKPVALGVVCTRCELRVIHQNVVSSRYCACIYIYNMNACMHVSRYLCIYLSIYKYLCIYICVCASIMYLYMFLCIYVSTYCKQLNQTTGKVRELKNQRLRTWGCEGVQEICFDNPTQIASCLSLSLEIFEVAMICRI